MPKTKAVILAAGLGTRMKSRTPKVLHPICGRPMLAYVIDTAHEATGDRPLVVYSPQTSEICEVFADRADFARQDEPRGTGDALRAALDALAVGASELIVMSGDVPLIDVETVQSLVELRRESDAPVAVGSMVVGDPTGYGRVLQRDGIVGRIVEEKDATDDERDTQLVNGGLYAFDAAWLRGRIGQIQPSAATGELYLTSLVEMAADEGRSAVTWTEEDAADEWTLGGINDRGELEEARYFMQAAIVERLQLSGVTVEGSTSVIDATVEIDADVILESGVILRGDTSIGSDTVVRSGSQIVNSKIGERCVVWASVVENSRVGNDVNIGPFAHLRAGCQVGDGAEIGNYAEQKNTRFGARSKQHHFSYLGDAEVGEDVNIGAGTITANFDGRQKHKTVIGNRAFIGSDTILRAPITVGEDAYTGAGSVVTKDVPDGKLAVGVPARIRERRARQDDPEIRERGVN